MSAKKRKAYVTYPTEKREYARQLLLEGYTIPQVMAATGIPSDVLKRWRQLAAKGKPLPAAPTGPAPMLGAPKSEIITPQEKKIEDSKRVGGLHPAVFRVIEAQTRKLEESLININDGTGQVRIIVQLHSLAKLKEYFENDPPIEKFTDAIRLMDTLRDLEKEEKSTVSRGIDAGILKMRHPANLPPPGGHVTPPTTKQDDPQPQPDPVPQPEA